MEAQSQKMRESSGNRGMVYAILYSVSVLVLVRDYIV